MVYLANNPYRASDIYHHGIKGQRWGVRRFQNPDGTLTEEGKRRYGKSIERGQKLIKKGETIPKRIGKSVGKQIAIDLAAYGAKVAIGVVGSTVALSTPAASLASLKATSIGYAAVDALRTSLLAGNIINVVKDVKGIDNATRYKHKELN